VLIVIFEIYDCLYCCVKKSQVILYFVGVLAYFQAQLADIMAYADLQPKVFQYFREIGNAIIFALHFEHAMVLYLALFITESSVYHTNIEFNSVVLF